MSFIRPLSIINYLKTSQARRTRRQHLNNLIVILLAGLIVYNIKCFWFGKDMALAGYTDFSAFYAGATLIKNGLAQNLYDYDVQKKVQDELFAEAESRTGPLLYYHPAFETLLFLPLAYCAYSTAYSLWVLINSLILIIVPLLLLRYLENLRPAFRVAVILSFYSFFPIFTAVYHGQDSIILLLLFTLAFISLKEARPLMAGLLLGLGVFKFHIVAIFMLLFLIKKEWKVIQGFSLTAGLLAIVSMCITGVQGTVQYINIMWTINQNLTDRLHQEHYAIYPTTMVNLRGLLYTLFAGQMSDRQMMVIAFSFSLVVVLLFFAFRRKTHPTDSTAFDLQFSLSIVVTFLASFHLHLHDYSVLMLPILLVSNHLAALSRPRGLPLWTLRLAVLLVLMTPVYIALIALDAIGALFITLSVLALLISAELHKLEKTQERLIAAV